jgi:hypothetical protein
MPPPQGRVSSTTPIAASTAQRLRLGPPPGPNKDRVNGPRNSSALAVPSGMRATASMKTSVSPAVTAPSTAQASRSARVKSRARGLTTASSSTPAQASRRLATPSGPSSPNRCTDSASPSWTQDMEPTAMRAPPSAVRSRRAARRDVSGGELMSPVERPPIIHVHALVMDIPSGKAKQ